LFIPVAQAAARNTTHVPYYRQFSSAAPSTPDPHPGAPSIVLEEVPQKELSPSQRLLPPFTTLSELMKNASKCYAEREALGIKNMVSWGCVPCLCP